VVFYLSEALLLRRHGIKKEILVLGVCDASLEEIRDQNIVLTIYNLSQAREVINFAEKNKQKLSIHLKIETGMNRLGFSEKDFYELLELLRKSFFIALKGACSHFADAGNSESHFSERQQKKFETFLGRVPENLCVHLCNSGGTFHCMNHFSMVRCGGALYGLDSSFEQKLKPILSWVTRIIDIHQVERKCCVGYGCTYLAPSLRKVAVVPVGYSDGLCRSFSNKGYMNIQEKKVPIVGRVAMNMTMIDVTGLNVSRGDEVIVMGEAQGVTITEYAQGLNTIEYEVATRINPLVKRIIIER